MTHKLALKKTKIKNFKIVKIYYRYILYSNKWNFSTRTIVKIMFIFELMIKRIDLMN